MYTQEQILFIAGNAAEIMLRNGGETYRVEEMVDYMCRSAGMRYIEPFVTPTGIMISVNNKNEPSLATVRRVRLRTINLNKVSEINNFSRRIARGELGYEEARAELERIDGDKNTYSNLTVFLATAIIAGSAAIFFQGSYRDFFPSFTVSLIMQIIIFYSYIKDINFFSDFIGGFLAGSLSIVFVSLGFGENLEQIIIGAIIPLVPGVAITNGIRDAIKGELVSGMTRSFEALWVSIAIASGVAASFYIFG
ncbi:uncharacterized membrane protein YjjP (DUF1212 family) [Desulfitispora alkaliphila]|uniref:threonine/serine ThrE exporter family protein n=1 Tax=Desulfitispora alkaliphila TaxID=622674 RepID=UPI003D223B45